MLDGGAALDARLLDDKLHEAGARQAKPPPRAARADEARARSARAPRVADTVGVSFGGREFSASTFANKFALRGELVCSIFRHAFASAGAGDQTALRRVFEVSSPRAAAAGARCACLSAAAAPTRRGRRRREPRLSALAARLGREQPSRARQGRGGRERARARRPPPHRSKRRRARRARERAATARTTRPAAAVLAADARAPPRAMGNDTNKVPHRHGCWPCASVCHSYMMPADDVSKVCRRRVLKFFGRVPRPDAKPTHVPLRSCAAERDTVAAANAIAKRAATEAAAARRSHAGVRHGRRRRRDRRALHRGGGDRRRAARAAARVVAAAGRGRRRGRGQPRPARRR